MRIQNIQKLCFYYLLRELSVSYNKVKFLIAVSLQPTVVDLWHFKLWIKGIEFAANSNFLIPISWQPDGGNPWYFILYLTEFIVWNI